MKRLALIMVFVAVMSIGVTAVLPVTSSDTVGPVMSEAEYGPLLDAAVKYSRYEKPRDARPTIVLLTPEQFSAEVCSGASGICPYLGVVDMVDPSHKILIQNPSPPQPVADFEQSRNQIIVHELIHWLQTQNGNTKRDCASVQAQETEAYSGAYNYHVEVEHASQPFWLADDYGQCMIRKMNRGHH